MSNNDTLQAWADIVLERFQQKVIQLRIHSSGDLLKSLTSQLVSDSNGDIDKIVFGFLYYGRFADMGVGKGVKISEVGVGNNRKAKPWFAKVFFSQVSELGRILAEKTGKQAQIAIIEGLNYGNKY